MVIFMKQSFIQYLYTDMAAELYRTAQSENPRHIHPTGNPLHDSGLEYSEQFWGNIRREKLVIADEESSSLLGKTVGTYYTVHTGDLRLLSNEDVHACRVALRTSLLDAITILCPDFKIPDDTCKNNTVCGVRADAGYDKGSVLRTVIDDPGEEAWDRLAVSPEWDQDAHLYPVPPAKLCDDSAAKAVIPEGEPFLENTDDRTAITDIPPAPLSEQSPIRPLTILVVGLGNPELTTDALGPRCVSHLRVTRHIVDAADNITVMPFGDRLHRLCTMTPLVLGKTGIETLELVRGAVQAVQPDLVILVDALAASELGSLTKTVQISTTGIHPGGGVGNKRQPLDKETLGVPVLTIGVPTVIAASTLIYRALEDAGILSSDGASDDAQSRILHNALADADIGYVAPKDIDESVSAFSRLIADTVNQLALGSVLFSSLERGF